MQTNEFDKSQLMNPDYALSKELLLENNTGAYTKTSVIFCNRKKTDGLFVCYTDEKKTDRHVLLASIDESIHQNGFDYNLGIHKYPGIFHLTGLNFIRDFTTEPVPTLTYCMGAVELQKQIILAANDPMVMIKYTLNEGFDNTILRLQPFLAFRKTVNLQKASHNMFTKCERIRQGIKSKIGRDNPYLHIQASQSVELKPFCNWYYNIEYSCEKSKKDNTEDLYVPAYIEATLNEGESIILAAGLNEINPDLLDFYFEGELEQRTKKSNTRIKTKKTHKLYRPAVQHTKHTKSVSLV